jgi:hypothetical protein
MTRLRLPKCVHRVCVGGVQRMNLPPSTAKIRPRFAVLYTPVHLENKCKSNLTKDLRRLTLADSEWTGAALRADIIATGAGAEMRRSLATAVFFCLLGWFDGRSPCSGILHRV